MKHLLLISHGAFAIGMLNSIEMIAGPHDDVEAMSIQMDTNVEMFKADLRAKCLGYGDDTIVIISDISGGSTTQCALPLLDEFSNLYLISGLNLGLVLEMLFLPDTSDNIEMKQRIQAVIASNQRSIHLIEASCENELDAQSADL